MKQLKDKQFIAGGIIALALISIHFFPALISSASKLFIHAPAVLPKPSAAIPYPPAALKPAGPGLSPQMQAAYLGKWEGSEVLPNNDSCRVKLEIRLSPDQPGQVSGYETRNCMVISPHASDAEAQSAVMQLLRSMNPVSTVMTGTAAQDTLTFHVDKTIGTSPDVCPMTSYAVSRFGDQSIVAQWQEGSCTTSAGQMVLARSRG
jgi:hypothetical protein